MTLIGLAYIFGGDRDTKKATFCFLLQEMGIKGTENIKNGKKFTTLIPVSPLNEGQGLLALATILLQTDGAEPSRASE